MKILDLNLEIIAHPPYSPDLSPSDYPLFWNLDNFLHGKIFNSKQAVENAFRALIGSPSPGFYAKGINEIEMANVYRCLRSILWISRLSSWISSCYFRMRISSRIFPIVVSIKFEKMNRFQWSFELNRIQWLFSRKDVNILQQ